MSGLRRVWAAVGLAGNLSFLVTTLGLSAALASIGAGLLAALTAIPTAFVIIAGLGAFGALVASLPHLLDRLWPSLSGPQLVIGEWSMDHRLGTEGMGATASVGIWNGRDAGGERVCARGVVPQLEIFTTEGERIYHHVGWQATNRRDFPATREEERLRLAEKKDGDPICLIGSCPPLLRCRMLYLEGRLTLRGDNLRRPMIARFSLGLDERGDLWVMGG